MTYPDNETEGPQPGPYQPYFQPRQTEPSTLAVVALVLGILGLTSCCLTGIPAIICGRIYLKKNLPENQALAKVGFWLGVISTSLGVLLVLVYGGLIALGLSGALDGPPDQR